MADDCRTPPHALTPADVEARDPFALLRRLECAHRDRPRWGGAATPADEPLRLGQLPSPVFPRAPLAGYEAGDANCPARLLVRFFGAFGPNGPLPLHLTELAYQRLHTYRDATFARTGHASQRDLTFDPIARAS